MKKEKKGLIVLTSILIILAGSILAVSLNVTQVIINTVSGTEMNQAITERVVDELLNSGSGSDSKLKSQIQNYIEESGDVKKITSKIVSEMTNCIKEGRDYENVDISEEVNDLTEGALTYMEKSLGKTENLDADSNSLLDNIKQKLLKRINPVIEDKINSYAQSKYEDMSHGNTVSGKLMKIYAVLIAGWFRIMLAAIIIVLAVAILIMAYPTRRALMYFGIDCIIIAAVLTLLINIVGNNIMLIISNKTLGKTVTFDSSELMINGLILGVAGFVMLLINLLFKKLHR